MRKPNPFAVAFAALTAFTVVVAATAPAISESDSCPDDACAATDCSSGCATECGSECAAECSSTSDSDAGNDACAATNCGSGCATECGSECAAECSSTSNSDDFCNAGDSEPAGLCCLRNLFGRSDDTAGICESGICDNGSCQTGRCGTTPCGISACGTGVCGTSWCGACLRLPVSSPILRHPVQYTKYWPDQWYGTPGARPVSNYPMVYRPTDTTQLGYRYHNVPLWQPNPAMLPQPPNPACMHTRRPMSGCLHCR